MKLKLMTIFGTRPEIIRLSCVIKQLDPFCEQTLVHTGQNYDENLSDIFFRGLDLRRPDLYLGVREGSFPDQVGQILSRVGDAMQQRKPDRVLILGDTNSGLSSVIAARYGIKVFHLEAGNRCYDDRVPEEINRRIIDHCSTVLMPYTNRSKDNLVREGIERERIFVVGNPIYEVLQIYASSIESSSVLKTLQITPHSYFLATMHREENVDVPERLSQLISALELIASRFGQPVIVSLHPRTADKIQRFGLKMPSGDVRLLEPMGFSDFVALEKSARCVITDSGTVQEECCIFGIRNVTIRDVTERPETIECGSNILSGGDPGMICHAVEVTLGSATTWKPPKEYSERYVSSTVAKIVLGFHNFSRRARGSG
ncbi:UDP-N-acetylglucosamine 2-epimerase (non-hydrolyzing) [Acidobacteria bacterium AH-259-O06]|nr:UDP-N-acetylglucosamine 2-epimerase (non-hydrolyzing) [Acidobacteria bacterium AH-259-O06]